MKRRSLFTVVPGFALALILAGLALAALGFSQDAPPARPNPPGQSATLLADGATLLLGGAGPHGPSGAAWLAPAAGGAAVALVESLHYPRAWHTATALADGSVAIIGGVGPDGKTVATAERFDPISLSFSAIAVNGLTPRSHHTGTLLSDGAMLIVGGLSADGTTLGSAQLWNPRSGRVTSLNNGMSVARRDQHATLQADGEVLIEGGVDAAGRPVTTSELYDPVREQFTAVAAKDTANASALAEEQAAPVLAGSLPADGATGVARNPIISLRFSEPLLVETLNADTITLTGPDGDVAAAVAAAEAGRLAFVNPASPLAPNATYTVTVDGAAAAGNLELPKTSITFTTGNGGNLVGAPITAASAAGGGEFNSAGVWLPTSDWRTHLPPSPWQSLPPLRARPGVTALSGQVLTIDGNPLANVTLAVGNRSTRSDASGRFLIAGLPPGAGVLLINGATANTPNRAYGIFQAAVLTVLRVTTVLPYTIWMPALDMAHAMTLPSPTSQETVASNPLMPGLELHIPAGTTITDLNGKVARTVSMTPVPLDRPPFPLPAGIDVPIYFTIQPGGAQLWNGNGKWAWAQLIYPNLENYPPGSPANFWNYDPAGGGWYIYGLGKVSADGKSVVPNPGVGFYQFTGAMQQNFPQRPQSHGCPPCSGGTGGGDPVDTSTGLFIETFHDLRVSDSIPIDLARTYESQDSGVWSFGAGMTDNFELYLTTTQPLYDAFTLILPDGQQVQYTNTYTQNLGSYQDAYFVPTLTSDPTYYGSTITWNGNCSYDVYGCWNLRLKNGTTYVFPEEGHLTSVRQAGVRAISDRHGNTLTVTRDANGNKQQITSPNGHWIQFASDSSNRITQATDDLGRTVTYTYDSCGTGYLCKVTDANGGVTTYAYYTASNEPPSGYGGLGDMSKIVDPRYQTMLTMLYDTTGRVVKQNLADSGSAYQFVYATNNGVSQASISDPDGNVEVKVFDQNGFVNSDTYASGTSVQQTTTFTRDPNTELVTGETDALGRNWSYGYDANDNLTNVGCANCLAQAVSVSATYDPTFNQLTSYTDPLNHTWVIAYDSSGDPAAITDPLNHQVTLDWNPLGQLVSFADAAGDTVNFTYQLGELATITDPLGNVTRRFSDSVGRLISTTDPLGNLTQFSYDDLDHLLQITDANGKLTKFTYDAMGNLLTVTDANNHKTSYVYDSRNRVIQREDALYHSDHYTYDHNSNLLTHTDRKNDIATFTWDALNRLATASYKLNGQSQPQDTIAYAWDAGDRLTQAADAVAGTIVRTWDGLNRLTGEQTPLGEIAYAYDAAGRRATMQVVGQGQVAYAWDDANRLTGITQGGQSVGLSYDNASRRTQLTLPNGVTVAYSYDTDSRVTGLAYSANGTQLGNLAYAYDAAGRRTAAGGSLAAAELPANVAGGTGTAYNADNEPTKFNGVTQTYDYDGNLTADGTSTYTWDARNQLDAIAGGASASFVYDAFGRRMGKTINGATTQFLYDGLNPVQELDGAAPPNVTANLLTGLGIDEYFTRTDAGGTMAFMADALGSTVGLVNSAGGIDTSYTYQPFGAATVNGTNANPYQFTGRENDGTGLYYDRARYYSPTYQRFIGQDPSDSAGESTNPLSYINADFNEGPIEFDDDPTNLYAYTGDDPVDWYDPDGAARRGGRPGKGEPGRDRKNPNPNKHTRPDPNRPGCWQTRDPQTGKWIPKGPGWSPPSNSQFQMPPPPPWLWIIPLLPWPGNPAYGGF